MYFDVIDLAIITNVIVDPQPEGLVLARATSYAGIAFLNDVEPVIFAIEEQVTRRTSDTTCRGKGLISQESQFKLVAFAFRTLGRGCFHMGYGRNPASLKPANDGNHPVGASDCPCENRLFANSGALLCYPPSWAVGVHAR
jgi:hypothetical protein